MIKRVNVIVHGRVQGVNFRRAAQLTARQLGVVGWVKNLPNGSVEGCFEGAVSAVDELVDWCRSGGPPAGRVDRLELQEAPATGEFSDFAIRF
ncbi:MAG TPA: acylphosphatase [Geobacteraceae bacterium]